LEDVVHDQSIYKLQKTNIYILQNI